MLKLILKNLWSRRRNNGWLMAELILVAVLSWVIFDPVIVVTYDRQRPLGYDADRLCMVSVAMLQPQAYTAASGCKECHSYGFFRISMLNRKQ